MWTPYNNENFYNHERTSTQENPGSQLNTNNDHLPLSSDNSINTSSASDHFFKKAINSRIAREFTEFQQSNR